MLTSIRARDIKESITLKLNERANLMSEKGARIYNLTAGQLPMRPPQEFVRCLESNPSSLKSFQYAPVAGILELRKKIIHHLECKRRVSFGANFDCVISNGAKHSIYNALGAIINPEDEIVILSPYWISYPEMVRCWGGNPVVVASSREQNFTPSIADIESAISSKTKAIMVNVPNNPSGIYYPSSWMEEFSRLMKKHPNLIVISDEIYYGLSYRDQQPTYFYQFAPELLERTIIVDGISKSLACTGLRIGYCLADKSYTNAISKIQAQTTSSANSLIQKALVDFDFSLIGDFLKPICKHLLSNSEYVHQLLERIYIDGCSYRPTSAFYYLLDFAQTPFFNKNYSSQATDYANEICSNLLEHKGIAIVPCGDFGLTNTGRISLVLEKEKFVQAMDLLGEFLVH